MPKISKRTQANREIYEALKAKTHAPAEAIAALRGYKQPKFDQSVEVVCSLGIDPKQADQQVRGSVSMPKGTGKTARVIVRAITVVSRELTRTHPGRAWRSG